MTPGGAPIEEKIAVTEIRHFNGPNFPESFEQIIWEMVGQEGLAEWDAAV